jgi:26S proteasome regulatory subunit N1
MAKDDKPSSSDKGKGKVEDIRELNGENHEDKSKSEKDDKPIVNGKKEEPKDGTRRPNFSPSRSLHGQKL